MEIYQEFSKATDVCNSDFNVAAFSYIGQYLVPDLARGLSHDPKKLAPAIALGQLIVCVLLIIVPMGVMYITPAEDLTQVATIAWGRSLGLWALYIANIFALIAMLTSYWRFPRLFFRTL